MSKSFDVSGNMRRRLLVYWFVYSLIGIFTCAQDNSKVLDRFEPMFKSLNLFMSDKLVRFWAPPSWERGPEGSNFGSIPTV